MMLQWLRNLFGRPKYGPERPPYAPMAWAYGMGERTIAHVACENGHGFGILTAFHDQAIMGERCKQCGGELKVTGFEEVHEPDREVR